MATTNYTSRRRYLTQTELAEFADITITDATEADDQISMAEELIDAYVGAQCRFVEEEIVGRASAGASTSFTLETSQQNTYEIDYFKWCEVEIIGGTGVGQRKIITGSTKAGVLTVESAWGTNPDSTSVYRIYQLGKFPRKEDVTYYSTTTPYGYYKRIPEAVKRATAAQVEYIIQMGANFFSTDKSDINSEAIGDYEYTKNSSIHNLIAPKAKLLLRGITNRKGVLLT